MTFATVVGNIIGVVNSAIPLLYALAFLFFLYGIVRYFFLEGGSDEGREKGKKILLYGLIGLTLLFAVWGVVNLLVSTVLYGTGGSTT